MRLLKFLFHRSVVVGTLIILQIAILMCMILAFRDYFVLFYTFCTLLSLATVLWIVSNKSNPAYKIAWIIPILLFPIFGGPFYLLFGRGRLSKKERNNLSAVQTYFAKLPQQCEPLLEKLSGESVTAARQSRYIINYAFSPLYQNTQTLYLPMGEIKFAHMLEELKKARHYIFLEYFIIQEGKMWDPILEILKEKAAAGLDVRVIYDDVGCLMTLPAHYHRKLESAGIQCCVFNPFVPVLSPRLNNRDHRKICVIDGVTGFTGGINLADEYINAYPKHGHWKDTSIMLKGEAVWSLTMMFLSLWSFLRKTSEDPAKFHPEAFPRLENCPGYVQPFTDSPIDDEPLAETVYMNLINKAKRYVYITTPYLIISNEMATALTSAAKAGVDVRIITPHHPDKAYVHAVTRAYYEGLIECGVKIYEYTPGFIHAKTFVVDGEYGVVGTINLDFRSLYLHFECGVWMYKTESIAQIHDDFLKTQALSQQITLEECRSVKWYRKTGRAILRLFAPLM